MTSTEDIQRIAKQLTRFEPLVRWDITVIQHPDLVDAASIEADHDLMKARVKVSQEYQRFVPGTLEELIAHELGHLFTDDIFQFIKATTATRAAEERLATRFGLLLILLGMCTCR